MFDKSINAATKTTPQIGSCETGDVLISKASSSVKDSLKERYV